MDSFESVLSVSIENIELNLRGITSISWSDFMLNPRRLRGSDFLMRWSQGVWSEHKVIEAVNDTEEFFALEYGPSGTAPDNDIHAFQLYFERLDKAGFGDIKRPDLLIFRIDDKKQVSRFVQELGGKEELPFTPEKDLKELLSNCLLAVECENSLWRAKVMPDYGKPLKPMKRLGGKPGLRKMAVVPTVILKQEDRRPLENWQDSQNIKIHIWHVFFDQSYGISFDETNHLIEVGLIQPTIQTYQAPGGATTEKAIYKFYYHYAYQLGISVEEPTLESACVEDKNGHILPYVVFKGGKLKLSEQAVSMLRGLR